MPIKPENRKLYAPDWKEISRRIRFERAQGRCEQCGALHNQLHLWGKARVILTTAHLDQDPTNNAEDNLRALCQRCHLNYDRPDNLKKAGITRARKRRNRQPLMFDLDFDDFERDA